MTGTSKLGRALGAIALGFGLMGASSCDEVNDAAEQCGFACEDEGYAKGNASITGLAAVDGFFKSSINFKNTANELSTNIKAEIDGLKTDLEITDAAIDAEGSIGAAIKAKFVADFKAELTVDAEPAKCAVDAQASFEASADCQVKAGCEIKGDPGKAEFECKGSCEVEAGVEVDCGADVDVSCTAQGPSVACTGSCKGSCTAELDVAATCEGTCNGTCEGKCEGSTDQGGACNGKCEGSCKGSCKVESSAGAKCEGSCSGECTVTGPELKCEANASAKCEGSAEVAAKCEGKCDGDFEPPTVMAECEASANCNASAKADASLKVECTPPSIDVRFKLAGSANGEIDAATRAKLDFKISQLKARFSAILALRGKANVVIGAGEDLIDAGENAAKGALDAFASGKVSASVKYKLASCAPKEFTAAASDLKSSASDLTAQTKEAASCSTGLIGG